jgi:hypothetical protein
LFAVGVRPLPVVLPAVVPVVEVDGLVSAALLSEVMLVPDEPPVLVAPEPASVAPLDGVEPAAPLLASPDAIAPPVVEVPAVPVEPIAELSAGVVVVVVVDDVSSAFLPQAPTLRAAAAARMVMAMRMGNP